MHTPQQITSSYSRLWVADPTSQMPDFATRHPEAGNKLIGQLNSHFDLLYKVASAELTAILDLGFVRPILSSDEDIFVTQENPLGITRVQTSIVGTGEKKKPRAIFRRDRIEAGQRQILLFSILGIRELGITPAYTTTFYPLEKHQEMLQSIRMLRFKPTLLPMRAFAQSLLQFHLDFIPASILGLEAENTDNGISTEQLQLSLEEERGLAEFRQLIQLLQATRLAQQKDLTVEKNTLEYD